MSYLTHFFLFNHKETLAVYLLASVDGSDHPVWKHLSGKKKIILKPCFSSLLTLHQEPRHMSDSHLLCCYSEECVYVNMKKGGK